MKNEPVAARRTVLRLSGATFGYPGTPVLSEVSFAVNEGEFIGVIGPNGSGKSTMIKGILGLVPRFAGEVEILGRNQGGDARIRKKIGYVPQQDDLDRAFPALVGEVVLMGLYAEIGWVRRPKKEHWARVDEVLARMNLSDLRYRPIGELSRGQQQRVMIARALVSHPALLFLDEPTAAVDLVAQHAILELLERLNKEWGVTVLMVTHDVNEIVHFADKLLLLNRRVVGYGEPAAVLTKERLGEIYGDRVLVYDHEGHPHVLVGDFNV